jgi:hypothetical protein
MKKTRITINIFIIMITGCAIYFLIADHTYAGMFAHTPAGCGDVAYEFFTPVPEPSGLTWDGQNFWTCGNDGLIYRFDADGTILHTIPMLDTGHMETYEPDVAWDGQYLWFFNNSNYTTEQAVFQLDSQDGSILKEFRNDWIRRAGDDGFGLEYSDSTLHLGLDQGSGYNRLIIIDSLKGEFVKETPLPG